MIDEVGKEVANGNIVDIDGFARGGENQVPFLSKVEPIFITPLEKQ
jgi:hypothetical protein